MSLYKFYSKGVIAEDMETDDNGSGIVRVIAEEHHTDDREYDAIENIDNTIATPKGGKISTKVEVRKSIQAIWFNIGDPNRITPPWVKKGEAILIWTYGESDKYFWSTIGFDLTRRRKEIVTKLFVNTDEEGVTADKTNSNWVEWNAIDKVIELHTVNNDGEKAKYDIVLNGGKGYLKINDNQGTSIVIDSVKRRLKFKSKTIELDANEIILNGGKLTSNVINNFENTVNFNAKGVNVNTLMKVNNKLLLLSETTVGSLITFNALANFTVPAKFNGLTATVPVPGGIPPIHVLV